MYLSVLSATMEMTLVCETLLLMSRALGGSLGLKNAVFTWEKA